MNALILDDEAPARRRLHGVLRRAPEIRGVEDCADVRSAAEVLRRRSLDLLFLDVRMPGLTGFDVVDRLPLERRPVVIFVTAHEEYAARAFAAHAFDYVLKPFEDARVLEAVRRVKSFIEWQRSGLRQYPVRFGDVRVDRDARRVYRAGEPISLRPKEYALLVALLRQGGRVVSRIELLREVWGYADDAETRTVDTHVARLRRHLEPDPTRPRHIMTVRPLGYRLDL